MDSPYSTATFLNEDFVLKEILAKLPVKSLMRFKSVSKTWLARISGDSTFIADHTRHHMKTEKPSEIVRAVLREDDENVTRLFLIAHGDSNNPVEIDTSYLTRSPKLISERLRSFHLLGSCNGLVLTKQVYDVNDENDRFQLGLWNPATREFRNLPEPSAPTSSRCADYHGIGFDEESNDYKIVIIKRFNAEDDHTVAGFSYALSSGCWRELEVLSGSKLQGSNGGVATEGAIFWAALRGDTPAKGSLFKLLRFDLRSDELKEINSPAYQSDGYYDHVVVTKWKGSLGALMTTSGRECEFWLKTSDDSGNGLCWTKMFVIKNPVSLWLFRGVYRDRFLLYDYRNGKNILYDPVTEKKRRFVRKFGRIICYSFHHYVPSLVSPN